jgi:hypothetical protein
VLYEFNDRSRAQEIDISINRFGREKLVRASQIDGWECCVRVVIWRLTDRTMKTVQTKSRSINAVYGLAEIRTVILCASLTRKSSLTFGLGSSTNSPRAVQHTSVWA